MTASKTARSASAPTSTVGMAGIDNVNEFYSHHYLDAVLSNDLKPLYDRWAQEAEIPEDVRPKNSRALGRRLSKLYSKDHTSKGTLYHGIDLLGGLFDDVDA